MQVYDIVVMDELGFELSRSNFEAADDAAAHDLLAHYYADQRCELWHGERLVQTLSPVLGEATA